ncbi:VOC family protein [Alkalihalophilus marmarensis]|uniref:VOC family protein n=1 Tax=Alkalihalophilus marmarensis TaxID=521377 RepID=UPI002DBFC388|nr:VOC family protein [Alkalihalophilus marmarensis]MEC2074143.1 VOC family protein [Alkalihalophilus marmarensis]
MGKVIAFEISSQQPEKAAAFYAEVFGWEVSEPHWDYRSIHYQTASEQNVLKGGISKGPHDFPHGTRIQIQVDNLDETIDKAIEHGAMVLREEMEFDDFYMAYIVDPTGVCLGLIEMKLL